MERVREDDCLVLTAPTDDTDSRKIFVRRYGAHVSRPSLQDTNVRGPGERQRYLHVNVVYM
jgi:hypothetical protein